MAIERPGSSPPSVESHRAHIQHCARFGLDYPLLLQLARITMCTKYCGHWGVAMSQLAVHALLGLMLGGDFPLQSGEGEAQPSPSDLEGEQARGASDGVGEGEARPWGMANVLQQAGGAQWRGALVAMGDRLGFVKTIGGTPLESQVQALTPMGHGSAVLLPMSCMP